MAVKDKAKIDEEALLAHLEKRLAAEFGHMLATEEIHRTVRDVASTWSDARVRHFIPILAERAARQRLTAAARTRCSAAHTADDRNGRRTA